MEEQAGPHKPHDTQRSSPAGQALVRPGPDSSVSSSVPSLRFPRPQGNQRLAIWVSSSSPDIMAASRPRSRHDSEDSLCESTFEFISRENEETSSQGDRTDSMSESLSEYERYPSADEVQAFGGQDDMSTSAASNVATDSDSEVEDGEQHNEVEEEGDDDSTRSLRSFSPYEDADADEILRNPLDQAASTRSLLPPSSVHAHANSIEFSEPEDVDVHIDKISVKHTIKEFNEDEAADFFGRLGLGDVPNRVSATIRQTMSQKCLSTQEAFRLFFVGDDALKAEIILKISRAITCSSSIDYNENKTLHRNTEGVYNIVPVFDIIPVTFGAARDRDVELMEASGFQIKVDSCVDAEKIPIDSRYFHDDIIYSLTVDGGNGDKKYKSVPAGGPEGARVQPAWTLPHVAVFYCSEDDDDDMQRIQLTAWEFCRRHAIPTLFISDHPAYDSPIAGRWLNHTNEHAVCLSLESRGSKTEQRFPIDLNSFLNIDNRQMNQNLAYLTGLQEPNLAGDDKIEATSLIGRKYFLPEGESEGREDEVRYALDWFMRQFGRDGPYAWAWKVLAEAILALVTCIFVAQVVALYGAASSSAPAVVPPPEVRSTAATATITINHTSTKTIRIAETPSFGGLLSDIAHTVSSEGPRSTVCSVQQYSDNEILLKLSSGTKEAWLAKGAIDIDVFRGDSTIATKLSSTDEGIIIEIPSKETHGVVNVSVITTRKPKINETFAVDFGQDVLADLYGAFGSAQTFFKDVAQKVGDTADGAYKLVEDSYDSVVSLADERIAEKASSWWDSIKDASKSAQDYSSEKAGETYDWVKDSIRPEEAVTILKDVQEMAKNQRRHVEDLRGESELAIMRAQIASKLWWLRVQGKTGEYEAYERQARDFMSKKHSDLAKAKKARVVKTGAAKCLRAGGCKEKGRWTV